MTASNHTQTVKKQMTPAQIAFYTGKRVSRDIWTIPEGYGICTITWKMLPESELMVTFAHTHFSNEQLAQLGAWGVGWCECAEWLSEEGYQQIMARVEACGLKEVYEEGYWGPAPVVAPTAPVVAAPVMPLLPAWTLTRPAPVIEDSALKMGDTITFTDKRGDIKQGIITAISIKSVEKRTEYLTSVNGFLYAVRPEQILPAKMPVVIEAPAAPVTMSDLYQTMKEAEEVYIRYMRLDTWDLPADHATYKRKVAAHIDYLRAQAAYTGLNNEYLITYLYGAKNAPQSRQEGATSAPLVAQVTPMFTDANEQEMALSRVLNGNRKTGKVESYNHRTGCGVIASGEEGYVFEPRNLKHKGMPIKTGDAVTFEARESFSIERGGRSWAALILVDGYTPAPRPAYQPSADLVADAKAADQPRKDARRNHRSARKQQQAANVASLKRVMGGGA